MSTEIPMAEEPASQAQQDYEEGVKFLEKNELTQAAVSFHNALKGFEEAGDQRGIANAADRLAETCIRKEDFKAAVPLLKQVLAFCEQDGEQVSLMYVKRRLAHALKEAGELDESLGHYIELLDIYEALNNPDGAVKALEAISAIYETKGERRKASDALKTAAAIHQSFKHTRHAEEFLARAKALEEEG